MFVKKSKTFKVSDILTIPYCRTPFCQHEICNKIQDDASSCRGNPNHKKQRVIVCYHRVRRPVMKAWRLFICGTTNIYFESKNFVSLNILTSME